MIARPVVPSPLVVLAMVLQAFAIIPARLVTLIATPLSLVAKVTLTLMWPTAEHAATTVLLFPALMSLRPSALAALALLFAMRSMRLTAMAISRTAVRSTSRRVPPTAVVAARIALLSPMCRTRLALLVFATRLALLVSLIARISSAMVAPMMFRLTFLTARVATSNALTLFSTFLPPVLPAQLAFAAIRVPAMQVSSIAMARLPTVVRRKIRTRRLAELAPTIATARLLAPTSSLALAALVLAH